MFWHVDRPKRCELKARLRGNGTAKPDGLLGTNPLKSLLTRTNPFDGQEDITRLKWEAEAASRQHGAHEDHAGGMEVGVSHAQHHRPA